MNQDGIVEKQVDSQDLKSCGASHGGSTPPDPTNNNQKIQEILDILQEECAEVIQNISKCRRFGMENVYLKGDGTQREQLVQELGDMLLLVELLQAHKLFTEKEIQEAKARKGAKLAKWSTVYD